MAKGKIKSNKVKEGISPNIVILVVIGILTVFYLKQTKLPVSTPTPTPTPTQSGDFPIDTVNDGVYTNYQYGFRFKYSKDIFKYQKDGPMWVNEGENIGGMGPTVVSKTAIQLQVFPIDEIGTPGADNPKERNIKDFNALFNLSDGQEYPTRGKLVKLSSYQSNLFRRVNIYFKSIPGLSSDEGEYYGAWWLKQDLPVVRMEYFAGSKETLEKYKSEFDKIVSSFEFFDHSTSPIK